MSTEPKSTCFVIMPFGQKTDPVTQTRIDFDAIYEYIIVPAVTEQLGLAVIRSDLHAETGWIHRDMLEHILNDPVAIVDITLLNPNVFYELGIRHALRKSVTVLMKQKGTQTPFNIAGMRIIDYGTGLQEAADAKRRIENFIRSGLATPHNDSLVYEVFPDLQLTRRQRHR